MDYLVRKISNNIRENIRCNSASVVYEKLCEKSFKNMEFNKESIKIGAFVFVAYLYLLVLKYVLYDMGFAFSTIFLVIGQLSLQIYFLDSIRFQEVSSLILFIFFDKDLIDIGNALLLLGVACIREELSENIIIKEMVSLACGLIFLLMGWSSVGRIFVIRFLTTVSLFALGYIFATFLYAIFREVGKAIVNSIRNRTLKTMPESTE